MNLHFVAAVATELGTLPGTAVGVGPVAAAVSAGRLLEKEKVEAVILLGTAGAFPGGPPPGSLVASRVLGFADPLGAAGIGYIPLLPSPLSGDPGLILRLKLPEARVLTSLGVTTHPGLSAHFGESWEVEHMEAYSVAYACAQVGVPFVALLGITNWVGPDAHAEWRANRAGVEAALQAHLRALGLAGGPGER